MPDDTRATERLIHAIEKLTQIIVAFDHHLDRFDLNPLSQRSTASIHDYWDARDDQLRRIEIGVNTLNDHLLKIVTHYETRIKEMEKG
jgi:hypothetical protein